MSANKQNPPGRHHFLPQFFIRRFSQSDDETVYVYNKLRDHLGTIPQPPGKICHESHLYSLETLGQRHPLIEKTFSFFEKQWADTFRMLDASEFEANVLLADGNGEKIVRFFYACQFWRSPKRKELASRSAETLLSLYDALGKAEHLIAPIERKELKRFVKLKASANNMKIIQNFLFPIMTYMTPAANGAKFRVVEKPKDYDMDLLCADVGIVGETIEEVFSSEGVKLFPLSRQRLLVLSQDPVSVTADEVDRFQRSLIESAAQHVFCATKDGLARHINRLRYEL
ncbi:DUF4238 domain-containing protein [Cupriavidus oxalaticus]|uniref:DUF4238 domain-containing protein n=1 Tax=Cupriavidus oxalaticus TaxID=96344 RepID=UPI00142F038C|nr:DUF4238 domain-containing protein [Cupriavidus oxalaticus]